jgi:hypothetical protein
VWISAWRPSGQNPPYGINCVVEIPVRGIGIKKYYGKATEFCI